METVQFKVEQKNVMMELITDITKHNHPAIVTMIVKVTEPADIVETANYKVENPVIKEPTTDTIKIHHPDTVTVIVQDTEPEDTVETG